MLAWVALQDHTMAESTDLLILNEAPLDAWFARRPECDAHSWGKAVQRHRPAVDHLRLDCEVVATMPLDHQGWRHQRSFHWSPWAGLDPWRFKTTYPR